MPKVTVELDYEQIDSIIIKELEERLFDICKRKGYVHPDDEEQDRILTPALFIVHEYYAGKEASDRLRDDLCNAARLL